VVSLPALHSVVVHDQEGSRGGSSRFEGRRSGRQTGEREESVEGFAEAGQVDGWIKGRRGRERV
jgi:hypothetical protein